MRDRIHDFTTMALRDGNAALRRFPKFASQIAIESARNIDAAVPESSRNVLRQVVDALADAAVATAHSVRDAAKEGRARGAAFVSKDAPRTMRHLRDMESNFVAALEQARKSASGVARDELDLVVRHAKRAAARITPAAQSAVKAVDGRVGELGVETAKAGVRATRRTVGGLLDGASGFLQALGEAARGR